MANSATWPGCSSSVIPSILFQCSSNSLYFSGNSKNRAGEAFFFFFLTKWQHQCFVCWRCCSLFDANFVYTTHKTSVLLFCEKEKRAATRRRRRILRLENYAYHLGSIPVWCWQHGPLAYQILKTQKLISNNKDGTVKKKSTGTPLNLSFFTIGCILNCFSSHQRYWHFIPYQVLWTKLWLVHLHATITETTSPKQHFSVLTGRYEFKFISKG